ncbi:MAG: 4-alpha-glucanotransferase, partial [Bryobacteraceae bacterium]
MTNTSPWGIDDRYEDGLQKWHDVSVETKAALLSAMGADESAAPPEPPLLILNANSRARVAGDCEIELEDGTRLKANRSLPRDLPLGYHTLRMLDSEQEIRLIVSPGKCYLRERFRTWGWSLQLYALRSQASWGIGDLEDLRRISTWSADVLSAGVIMSNPIGAPAPGVPQQPSPYFPSSRLFRNPLYLRIEEIPAARTPAPDLEQLAAQGRALNKLPVIDRDAIYHLKLRALEEIWARTREKIDRSSYEQEQGRNLDLFAAFSVLAEQHGTAWRNWPAGYRHPDSIEIAKFSREFEDRIRFHKWVQSLIDSQLARLSNRPMLVQDLPIGVDPDGFDAWLWQDVFAKDVSVGAPPDPFSANGQNWGLPPFVPHKLRAAAYDPFIQTVRTAMRYSAGLRIDHVMGLFRLFWIPNRASGQGGAYVRYNADELLSILALESARAEAFV